MINSIKHINKVRIPNFMFGILTFFIVINVSSDLFSQGIYLSPNAVMTLGNGVNLRVNGNITLSNSSQFTQQSTGDINITGNWTNNGGTVNPGNGTITFLGTTNSTIGGTSSTDFYLFIMNKISAPNNILLLTQSINVSSDLTCTNGVFRFDNTAASTLSVTGNLSVSNTSSFQVASTGGPRTHTFNINGNITNNGTFDLLVGSNVCNTTFRGSATSVISGTGATTEFNEITLNKTSQAAEVQVNSSAFTTPSGYLTLLGGTFHIMGTVAYANNTVFKQTTPNNYSIPLNAGFWMDNPNITVLGQDATANLGGLLRITTGTLNVGTGANNQNHLLYSSGSRFLFESGTVNITSRFSRDATAGSTINFTMNGGTLNLGTGAVSAANDRGSFDIGSSSSTFNWSAGTIELKRSSSNTDANGGDYIVLASSGSVSAGTLLRINAAAAAQTHRINSVQPVGELLINAANNPIARLLQNNLTVYGNVTINGTGAGRLDAGSQNLTLGGNFTNNATDLTGFTAGTGRVTFNGSGVQNIQGTARTTFNILSVNKSASKILIQNSAIVNGDIRLISDTAKIDIQTYNLTLGVNAGIYSDDGTTQAVNPGSGFTASKSIYYSANDATGGSLIKNITSGTISTPTIFGFPLSTKDPSRTFDVYTPARIIINEATIAANASITMKPVPIEQPNVRTQGISLKKFWRMQKANITLGANRADLRFWYHDDEVQGNEGNYRVLRYNAGWLIDPGISSIVNFNTNQIITERVADAQFDGDWTGGEEQAGQARYYSIADGNYSNPTSWSKIAFGGPVSNDAPNISNDLVYIGDAKTITLTANTPNANLIEIQAGGTLKTSTFTVNGDTCRLKPDGKLGIGDANGIVTAPTASGNVRTTVRIFDSSGIYLYNGAAAQVTGSGLPLRVKNLVCEKPANQVLTISNNVTIGDTLMIINGTIDDNGKLLDGETSGRIFIMQAGEIILRKQFPNNYSPPTFTAGRVNFDGTSNTYIPSSGSTPGVNQYNDLRIGGARGYADIVFQPLGEIKIQGAFTINNLSFTNFNIGNTRLRTAGSTINFNGANQNIPRNTASSANGDDYQLLYHNLKIAGTGTKSLIDGTHRIYNEMILESATLAANGFDIEMRGNWNNTGGDFDPGTRTVTFNIPTAATTKTIVSRGVAFYNLTFQGLGTTLHNETANMLTLKGAWNCTGDFDPGTGTVQFNGTALQTITNTNTETFYNLSINNSAGVRLAVGSDISVSNNLDFVSGVLDARQNTRSVILYGTNTRSGTGHVNGNLRINIPTNATGEITYQIGSGQNYRPAKLTFSGTGGTAGLLNIIDTSRTVALAGSGINTLQNVERQWEITIPLGSTFGLGTRTYDLILQYLNPADIRGGADPNSFITSRYNLSWYSTSPGTRTSNSTQSLGNNGFGVFVVGPATQPTYYSIADGNWNSANTWSTASYGGAVATSTPSPGAKVYIGDGKTVTLNINYTTNASDSVIVEKAGPSNLGGKIVCGTNTISGSGSFALRNGGAIATAESGGLAAAPAASGSIRTTNRNYNEGNHNSGHFIYNRTTGPQNTGDGLPATVATLTINTTSQTVSLTSNITIRDSLDIISGTLSLSAFGRDIDMKGNWRNSGSFTQGSRLVTFSGTGLQLITNSSGQIFYNLKIDKASGKVMLEPSTYITVTNNLDFTSGVIDSRTNSQFVIIQNGASVTRSSGHVDGELRKYIPVNASNTTYEIGSSTAYTPGLFQLSGTGGTAGFVAMTAYEQDHPDIGTSGLDLAKNVQRYWKLAIPSGSTFALDNPNRTYNMTVTFLNPDDIRGGANTSNFILKRYQSGWNLTTSGTRTTTTTQATGLSVIGDDFVVGESGTSRVFWTRANGNWNDANTWSEIAYGGAASTNWPDNNNDIVYIGNANEVNMNGDRTVSGVTVEAVGGMGVLNLGTSVLYGNQFTLKTGGKLIIGSQDGITASTANGNIQTSIRNYNHNNHNNGNFEYVGGAQNSGNGLPGTVANLTSNVSGTLLLTGSVTVGQDLTISGGTFSSNNNNIFVKGNWINNGAYTAGSASVRFNGTSNQEIRGSSVTAFYDLYIDKTSGTLGLQQSVSISDLLNWAKDGLLVLNTYDVTLETGASITGSPFGSARMIQSDGSASSGRVIKKFNSGNGLLYQFTFPVGVGSVYNEAVLNLTGNYDPGAQVALRLRSGLHPNRLNDNILNKYWNIQTSGITLASIGTDYHFTFQAADVNGTQSRYIPARYNSGWEVNLGSSRNATTSPMNIQEEAGINGDWTAGEPSAIFTGRVYYSRADNVNWNVNTSWSNISHVGVASAYYPGEKFAADTVYIANNNSINYTSTPITIGKIVIGNSLGLLGQLRYQVGSNKALNVLGDVWVQSNGVITEVGGVTNRADTLSVGGNFINDNTTANAVDLRPAAARYTILRFFSNGADTVRGSGNWRLSGVQISKNGLSDTLINQAVNFTNAITTATALAGSTTAPERFLLNSGVYCHDNNNPTIMECDRDGATDGATYQMGVNSGIDIKQGDIRFNDDFLTNTNTSIKLSGGRLRIGRTDSEDLKYNSGTNFSMTGGECVVQASFSRSQPNSTIDFNISGGTLRVVISRNTDGIGFDIAHNSSTFTQSGGTIVITDISNPGDYSVNAGTVSVTGGTLQIGEAGDPFFSTTGDIAVGNQFPTIWNLDVRYTRTTTNLRALIVSSNPLYVKNDVLVEPDGCLDLNTYSMTIGGDFINQGTFDTDGPGWDNGGGIRSIRLVGDGASNYGKTNQIIRIDNALVVAQDPSSGSYRNEAFYELIIDKPNGGLITLDNTANSNLLIRNLLLFAQDNTAIINARTNNKYVWLKPELAGEQGRVERLSEGHVDGLLIREFATGDQNVKFDIGFGTAYTPATLVLNGAGGTAGQLQMITYGVPHPQILTNTYIDQARDIERYWRLSRPASSGFLLGARNYNLTLEFLSSDVPPLANWSLFEQYRYPSAGPWATTTTGTRTSTTTQSLNNTALDFTSTDFVIGESSSTDYYSRRDGPWSDPNSWSLVGYGGPPAPNPPTGSDAQAHIGDGNTIWLDRVDSVKALLVENIGAGPGHFDARTNLLRGLIFTLNDGCYFTTANEFGIRSSLNIGSILFTQRNYGVAHYKYNSSILSQSTGDGLPSATNIASLTIDNSALDSASSVVFLSNDISVNENIYIKDGNFFGGSRNIDLRGDFIIDNGATFVPSNSIVNFNNTSDPQHITINDSRGASFNNLYLSKSSGDVIIDGAASNGYVFVKNHLRFSGGNNVNINSRANDRKVVIQTGGSVERNGSGHVDGTLQKPIGTAVGPYLFEIGDGSVYTPVTLTFNSAGGVAGQMDAINISPVPDEPFYGNRMDPTVRVNRYWKLEPVGSFSFGTRTANLKFEMPPSEITTLNLANTVIRRHSIPEEAIPWTERRYSAPIGDLLWTPGLATVELKPAANQWPGIGEFFIGEKAKRIFFSRNGGGNWDDNNSWAFDAAGTILAPAGEYPNADWNDPPGFEYEVRDSVTIQNNDIITLNTKPELANIILVNNGSLIVNDGYWLEQSHYGISTFEMTNNSTLNNKSQLGIQTDTSLSIIRFANRTFANTCNYEFSGVNPQTFGDAFPSIANNITISNTGAGNLGIVALKPNNLRIDGNLSIASGELRAFNSTSSINLAGDMLVDGIFDGSQNPSGIPATTSFTFQKAGSNQVVSGSGSIIFYDMNLDLGAGPGILNLNTQTRVKNVLDLLIGANPNNQIVALGPDVNLFIDNTDVNSLRDYTTSGVLRYIRTGNLSGTLVRKVTVGNTYNYPVGSFDFGTDRYTPARFTAGASGVDGYVGVRVAKGTNPGPQIDGHLRLDAIRTTDYLKRYWTLDNVTTTIPGRWRFDYMDPQDIGGQETDIVSIGKWRPIKEAAGGGWVRVSGTIYQAANYFESDADFPALNFEGDWTLGNNEAFRRIFYTRQSGNWNDLNTWTYSPTHSGPIAGAWPDDVLDSAVVGGGNAGVGDHIINLNVDTPVSPDYGVALGTATNNSGTLDCNTHLLNGGYFTIGDYSTLKIGSPDGITTLGNATGSIRTTVVRQYSGPGIFPVFEYNGTSNQVIGNGLPNVVRSLGVTNTGPALNNTVNTDRNISIMNNLYINTGVLDIHAFTVNNSTGTGTVTLGNGGWLRLDGPNNLSNVINNYSVYNIDAASVVEFYGSSPNDQTISTLPANLTQNFILNTGGLGHVILNNSGTKTVSASLLIRGDMTVMNNAILQNNAGVDALAVRKNVINSATINNYGVIEIGN